MRSTTTWLVFVVVVIGFVAAAAAATATADRAKVITPATTTGVVGEPGVGVWLTGPALTATHLYGSTLQVHVHAAAGVVPSADTTGDGIDDVRFPGSVHPTVTWVKRGTRQALDVMTVPLGAPTAPGGREWVLLLTTPARAAMTLTVAFPAALALPPVTVEIPALDAYNCNCPEPDRAVWRARQACLPGDAWRLAAADWARWPTITEEDLARVEAATEHIVRYTVLDNVLYGRAYPGGIVGIRTIVEEFLLGLLRHVRLADVEFIINFSDFPALPARPGAPRGAVFSMCTTRGHHDLLLPTYESMRSSVYRHPAAATSPWRSRRPTLVWRGTDSNALRFDFNRAANAVNADNNDGDGGVPLTDVGLSAAIRAQHNEAEMGPVKRRMDFHDFTQLYKYPASVDGSVAAYRLPLLLAGGSLLFKQDSEYDEHFYGNLEPGVHYVPFRADNADIAERVRWARAHDAEAYATASRGQRYALYNLTAEQTFCHAEHMFATYAARMAFAPQIRPEMTRIDHPFVRADACSCADAYRDRGEL